MENKKESEEILIGKDGTAEAAKKAGKKVSNELPPSYYKETCQKDKEGNIIPE